MTDHRRRAAERALTPGAVDRPRLRDDRARSSSRPSSSSRSSGCCWLRRRPTTSSCSTARSASARSTSSSRTGTSCSRSAAGSSRPGSATRSYYSFSALAITLHRQHPGRVRARAHRVQGPPAPARHDAHRDAHPEHRARPADLPRAQRGAPHRQPARRDPAVLVLPVRGVPHLHLLLDGGLARPAQRRAHRRRGRAAGLRAGRAAARDTRDRARRLLQLRGNWNNYFLPFLVVGGAEDPGAGRVWRTCSPTCRRSTRRRRASIVIQLPTLALATLLSVAPILLIFLFAQRFLVEGMTAGGTKE